MDNLPNGITSHGRTVTNDIGALLRDHAKRRAYSTNGGTVFSTRHVGATVHDRLGSRTVTFCYPAAMGRSDAKRDRLGGRHQYQVRKPPPDHVFLRVRGV